MRVCWHGSLVLLFVLSTPANGAGAAARRQADQYTISVDVDLAVLHATVENRRGEIVSGLNRQNFRVFEDGVLQEIRSFGR
ncbi:MAG: hypothetical protein HYX72_10050 [Acidobacteria bacterium]|nr:hypothetical protein [Acidobacteriota bacterium]